METAQGKNGSAETETVDASPHKSFFVSMLTRDIELQDAILDLLDNCIDGVVRTLKGAISGDRPYAGFKASVTMKKDTFEIVDNCGGIPIDIARRKAFMM